MIRAQGYEQLTTNKDAMHTLMRTADVDADCADDVRASRSLYTFQAAFNQQTMGGCRLHSVPV